MKIEKSQVRGVKKNIYPREACEERIRNQISVGVLRGLKVFIGNPREIW